MEEITADTVKKMKCAELAAWLMRILDDDAYESDVQKLIDANINGRQFLNLPNNEGLLSELKLTIGGKDHILTIVKQINDGTFKSSQAQPQDMDLLWCSTIPPGPVIEMDGSTSDEEDGRPAGYVEKDDAWPWEDYPKLLVQFMNEIPPGWTVGNGAPMNKENILEWANRWHQRGGGNIPCFEEAKPGQEAQIRIQFNSNKLCSSFIGWTARNVPSHKPTMHLDLHKGGGISDRQKKRHVIHEFGHALGLRHEHQRSDFWACISPYIDKEQMKSDTRANLSHLSEKKFKRFWNTNFEVGGQLNPSEYVYTQYDSTSIMHYSFRKTWLTHGYDDKSKVEKDRDDGVLEPEVAAALLGVHERHRSITYEPSALDIKTLQRAYPGNTPTSDSPIPPGPERRQGNSSGVKAGTKRPRGGSTREIVPAKRTKAEEQTDSDSKQEYNVDITNAYLGRMVWNEDGQEKVVRIYNKSKNMWRQIGENLGIDGADLDGFEERVLDDRIRRVLGKWQENARGLPHSDKYPKTWRGLLKLLKDSDLKELAENVHKALLQQEQPRTSGAAADAHASTSVQPMTGSYLTDKDLREVKDAVYDARVKWYNTGLELGILAGDLDDISTNQRNNGDNDKFLGAVLTTFLHQVDPRPSWKRLADAMASRSVGRPDIAAKLRKKYHLKL